MCGRFTCASQKYLQYAHTKEQSVLYHSLWCCIKPLYNYSGKKCKLCFGKT